MRNAQLNLARARAILQEQELELTHQLTDSFREISLAYQQMQTTLSAYRAANEEVRAVQNAYDHEHTTLDQLLQAQRRQSEAETSYFSSVINYNLAIMTLHHRKGSLLEYNNVCLLEGPWPSKAYFDAKRRARSRDAGHYFNYGLTLPRAVSRGTYLQHQHGFSSGMYEVLQPAHPGGIETAPPVPELAPPVPTVTPTFIEANSSMVIPTPMLPAPNQPRPSGNTPVSFVSPEIVGQSSASSPSMPTSSSTSASSLTPARNMRYVAR